MYSRRTGSGDEIYSHAYLSAIDENEPIVPQFYAFGGGHETVKILDVQVHFLDS